MKYSPWMILAFVAMNYFACIAVMGAIFEIRWLAIFGMVVVSASLTTIMALGLRYYLKLKLTE